MSNQLKKKQPSLPNQPNVEKKRSALSRILPKGKAGNAILSIQLGDFCLTIPVPLPEVVKKSIKESKTKSRSVADIGDYKIGLDII